MSWLGNLAGGLAASLFPGARAIVTKFVDQVVEAVVDAGREFVNDWMKVEKDAATKSPEASRRSQRSRAEDLAKEERELAEKLQRDKARAQSDADRIDEINAERERMRKEAGKANAFQAAKEIAEAEDLISAKTTGDELASQVGILSTKPCPQCGGFMTLQFESNSITQGQKFKWRCTAAKPLPCPSIFVRASELEQQVSVRKPNADLDVNEKVRKSWSDPALLVKTAGRVRSHMGSEDDAILCPVHLTSMKLLPIATGGGLLLDNYQYTCLGVQPNGKACSHTIPIKSFGQVSGLLTRLEGQGIL